MKKASVLIFFISLIVFYACSKEKTHKDRLANFILIKGGTFINKKSKLYGKNVQLKDFYMSKSEITQKEWIEIMQSNPSQFKGSDLPVEMVSWYDCIVYCNKRSIREGLSPYYSIDKDVIDPFNISAFDDVKWTVTTHTDADGYRLPTEVEWEYAAGGGQLSNNYTYSGSDYIDDVAWYWRNCGDTILKGNWNYRTLQNNRCRTRPVNTKKPNELGLYDMTGNVREWCQDWFENDKVPRGHFRTQRGGGWIGVEIYSKTNDRDYFEANGIGPDQGFRICRNKKNKH